MLHWTAPGDDGYVGQAAVYDLRYQPQSAGPLNTEMEWAAASQVTGEPAPSPAGYPDSALVNGLTAGARYYFCLRTLDEAGNISGFSNSPLLTAQSACFSINVEISGCGSVTFSPDQQCYSYGDSVTLTATPCPSYHFASWGGDIHSVSNPLRVVITNDLDLSALFWTGFLPGDANGNGLLQMSDMTYLINYFQGLGPPPNPYLAGDANGNCFVNGADVTYILSYFRGYGAPPIRGVCDPSQQPRH